MLSTNASRASSPSCCSTPTSTVTPIATAPSNTSLRETVRDQYGRAVRVEQGAKPTLKGTAPIIRDLYAPEEAASVPLDAIAASFGCGNPVALAKLKPGQVVLDLGSGGGIDVLLSAKRVGPTGKTYGLDMTPEMLALARKDQLESGTLNAEFLEGPLEAVTFPEASTDVVISNCVVSVSNDKDLVLREAYRCNVEASTTFEAREKSVTFDTALE